MDAGGVNAIARLPDGRLAAVGSLEDAGGDLAGFLLMLDANGVPDLSSLAIYDRSVTGDDVFQGLIVDRAGRLLVCGYTTNASRDLLLLRLVL